MRTLVLALAATAVITACSNSSPANSAAPPVVSKAVVSCDWGGTCDQYSGADPTFATNLEATCKMYGTAFAQADCPTTNQVAGHCQIATSNGTTNDYFYYSPKFDAASAQADCTSAVVGVKWVP